MEIFKRARPEQSCFVVYCKLVFEIVCFLDEFLFFKRETPVAFSMLAADAGGLQYAMTVSLPEPRMLNTGGP